MVNCIKYIHIYVFNIMYLCMAASDMLIWFGGFILDFYFLSAAAAAAACQSAKTRLFCYINICEFRFQITYLYKQNNV